MADAAWDDDDYEPEVPAGPIRGTDKWAGEDEEDEVKDNWDDEDEEDDEKKGSGEEDVKAVQKKKKRTLKEAIAEKEEKQRQEMLERKKAEEEEAEKQTPEEIAAEKLRQQRLQEDSDLELAKQAFGVTEDGPAKNTIDAFNPASREEFEEFSNLLRDKILKYEKSGHYIAFLEILYRDLAAGQDAEEIKKLSSGLSTLANEKQKKEKGVKGKKKKGAKPKVTEGDEMATYDDRYYDEFDDFI